MKDERLHFSTFEQAHIVDGTGLVHFWIDNRPPPSSANWMTSTCMSTTLQSQMWLNFCQSKSLPDSKMGHTLNLIMTRKRTSSHLSHHGIPDASFDECLI